MSFKPLNKKTMTALVLDHLKRGKSITAVEAAALWRCRSLTKRIHEIREMGHDVRSEWAVDTTGQRYVRYFLVVPE
ncbi:helix-turn-helix domain-containing protein [Paracoccus denitrificans]|uniref:helix-turn-helix domain-containing protein n=1 Tax=Paracoccus denitrificans TaxID=266 RepID=UPI001E631CB3|nr:helix-turn-helix domain-containing protein [Paracoccus denitrificans]UFS66957.1 helix-turn-helix domain-containing protein [Paracoccus denitrificans]